MPNNLTDDPAQYAANIQVPAAGDPRTDTSVATPFQQVANRTGNITARLNIIAAPTQLGYSPALPAGVSMGSVPLIATSIAVMQTIPAANRANGQFCTVADGGLYYFDIASTTTAQSPWVIQPSDVIGGAPGRWSLLPYGALGVANGLVQADATGRTPAAGVRNGIVFAAFQGFTAASVVGALADVAGSSVTIPGLLVGDQIFVSGHSIVQASGTSVGVAPTIVNPSPATIQIGLAGAVSSSGGDVPMSGYYAVTVAGTHTYKIQASSTVGTAFLTSRYNILVVRP